MKKVNVGQAMGVLANVGVLVGILLLVYELSLNRQMMRAQTRNAIAETLVSLQLAQATSPELLQIVVKSNAGEQLTPVEHAGLQRLWRAYFRYWENVNYQYRNGLYDDIEYFSQREAWREPLTSNAWVREFWCGRQDVQSPEFYTEITGLLGGSGCE